MKKWLVGLMAAGLCAASAWADGVATLPFSHSATWQNATVDGMTVSGLGQDYKDGSAKFDTTADSIIIHFTGTPGELSYGIKGNSLTTTNISTFKVLESANGVDYTPVASYSSDSNLTNDRQDVTNALSATSQYVQFLYEYKAKGNVGIYDVVITSGGPATFSVSLALSGDSQIAQGSDAYVTATPKNAAEGVVGYVWTSENGGSGADNVYTINTSVAGDFTVSVKATDAEGNEAEDSIEFSVVKAYTVSVEDGIQNGTVEIQIGDGEAVPGPVDVAEGTIVTVIATPADRSYQVESITVETEGGTPVQLSKSNTFEMPAENVWVGATFVEKPPVSGDAFTRISSVDGLADGTLVVLTDPDGTVALSSTIENNVFTATAVEPDGDVITTDDATIIWKLVDDGNGNFSLYNEAAEKYAGHAGGASSNSGRLQTNAFPNAISVADAEVGLFLIASTTADGGGNNRDLQYNYNSGNPRFAYYKGTQKNLRIYAAESGPAPLRVSLDQENPLRLDVGTGASVTATATGGEKPYTFAWECSTVPELNGTGETLAIPDTLGLGTNTVWLTVSDSSDPAREIMQAFVVVVQEPAVPHDVKIAVGMQGGVVTADPEKATVGETVTLTATPADGKKLESMTVTYGGGETTLTFTSSPAEFEMPDEDVDVGATFVDKPAVAGFTKITSLDELTEGEYVLVGSDTNGAYGAVAELTGSTKVLSAAAVTIEDDTVVDAEESQIWTLAQVEGGWTIYNEALGFLGYSGSQNSAMAEAEASEKSTWTFSVADGELFKVANVGTEGRTLRYNYNKGNMRFACYTSDTLPNIALYKGASGPAPLRVSLDQENPLRLDVGTGASVTATATGGEKPYTFTWECSTAPELNGTGETLAIPDTLGLGTNTVWLTVSDSSDPAREIMQAFVVVVQEPAAKYAITVERVPGGVLSVEGDKTEAEAGETVKVTATADEGQKLVAITVTGDTTDLSFTSSPAEFEMPAEAVTVSAVFEEFEIPPYYFQFETGASIAYATNAAAFVNTGSTATEEDPTVAFTVQRTTLGKDAGDKVVGTQALRMAPIGETNSYAFNSAAFAEPITGISFQYGIYGTSDKCDSFTVSTSSDGENWTLLADLTKDASYELKTYENGELPENTYFVRFDATNSVKGNSRRMDVDEIQLFTGAPKPSVSLSASATEVEIGDVVTITATAKNFSGDVEWAWEGTDGGSAEGAVYTVNTSAEGTFTVKATATYGDEKASKDITVTVKKGEEPPPPSVTLTCEPASVTMAEGESAEVTVTLDGVDSFDGYIYIVDHEDMCSEEGENPWTFDLADLGLSASDEPYVLTLIAYDGDGELAQTTLSVTVSGEGPQPGVQPVITGIDVQSDKVVVTFTGDGSAVEGTDDLGADWSDVDATISGGTATVPNAKRFLRIRQ